MKKIAMILASVIMMVGLAVPLVQPVFAASPKDVIQEGLNAAETGDPAGKGTDSGALSSQVTNIINIMLFAVGVISLIVIILGGIRYTTSGGKQDQVTSAKNTIMYAVIGLIVALLGFAIVNFVITNVGDDGGSSGNTTTTPTPPASSFNGNPSGCTTAGFTYDNATSTCR